MTMFSTGKFVRKLGLVFLIVSLLYGWRYYSAVAEQLDFGYGYCLFFDSVECRIKSGAVDLWGLWSAKAGSGKQFPTYSPSWIYVSLVVMLLGDTLIYRSKHSLGKSSESEGG